MCIFLFLFKQLPLELQCKSTHDYQWIMMMITMALMKLLMNRKKYKLFVIRKAVAYRLVPRVERRIRRGWRCCGAGSRRTTPAWWRDVRRSASHDERGPGHPHLATISDGGPLLKVRSSFRMLIPWRRGNRGSHRCIHVQPGTRKIIWCPSKPLF